MSLLARLEGKGDQPIKTSLDLFREVYGGWRSNTGQTVNWSTALQVTTVLAVARAIANGLSLPPCKLMREGADGKTKAPAKDHPLYALLHDQPNHFQTAVEFLEMLGLHLVLCGGHYSYINRMPGTGRILSLLPFEPQHVAVKRDEKTGELRYKVQREEGAPMEFPAQQIWHVKGLSWNGYLQLEPVKLAREAIGLSMATEENHAKMHKNGARVGGLISVEGTLTDDKYQQMRKWLEKYFEGTSNENAHRTMILDRAAKFTAAQQTGVDAQHLETRRYQVEEICRSMGVLPIIVGYSDKASTYASAEQMFIAHERLTLAPLWRKVEQSIGAYLLTAKERAAGLYAKFIAEGMLRGSAKDTKDVILGYVNGGIMTPNEGRAKLDLNPDKDPKSDELRIPANVVGEPDQEPDGDKPPKQDDRDKKSRVAPTVQVLFGDGAIKVAAPQVTVLPASVEVKAYLPEQAPPEVHVHPELKTDVHVAPAQVEVKVDVSKIEITKMPARESVSKTERNKEGAITRVTQTERDA